MAIIARATGSGSKYRHPEGVFAATCIDVIDLGEVETSYNGEKKKVHKIVIRFFAGELNEGGEPLFAGERFTLSLSERATLRRFLEAWRGRAFTDAELAGFDVEKLIGASAYIQITHKPGTDGKVYANITSAMRLPPGTAPTLDLPDYVRVCDRLPESQHADPDVRAHNEDDDMPF